MFSDHQDPRCLQLVLVIGDLLYYEICACKNGYF
jgi:hypothetical protein